MRTRGQMYYSAYDKIGYIIEPDGPLGKAAIYARAYTNAIVGLAGDIEHNRVDMSLRTNVDIDLNIILNKITPQFNGHGGGHAKAAGAMIHKDRLEEFIKALDVEVSKTWKTSV